MVLLDPLDPVESAPALLPLAPEPLPVDDYSRSHADGAFLLVDPADGWTLAAGMVRTDGARPADDARDGQAA